MRPLLPPFYTFGDVYPEFQSQGGFPCFCSLLPSHNRFLRFTFGVTPADHLVVSMAAQLFHSCTCIQAVMGLESSMPLPHSMWQDRRSTDWAMPTNFCLFNFMCKKSYGHRWGHILKKVGKKPVDVWTRHYSQIPKFCRRRPWELRSPGVPSPAPRPPTGSAMTAASGCSQTGISCNTTTVNSLNTQYWPLYLPLANMQPKSQVGFHSRYWLNCQWLYRPFFLNLRVSSTKTKNLKWQTGGDINCMTLGKFVTSLIQKLKILGVYKNCKSKIMTINQVLKLRQRGRKLFRLSTPSTCFDIHSIGWYDWKGLSLSFPKLFADWKLVKY